MSEGSGTAVAGAAEKSATNGRRGSRFSDKQIARAVKDRRAIEILSPNGESLVTGFVYGMDDYHLGIADVATGATTLVHKASAGLIRFLSPVDSYPGWVQDICEPFRDRVMKEQFGQQTSDLH